MDGHNQYPPMMGIPELRQAVAEHAKRFQGLDIDWQSEVLVTSGATEALGDCLLGLIEPGDEVVLIEPLYDSYLPIVRRAGGCRQAGATGAANLAPAARRTRGRLQRPHQAHPVQHADEPVREGVRPRPLAFVAGSCQKHDAYAVCDEVYEHIIFDDRRHLSIMTVPGMRERHCADRVGGKGFSVTGWKVGYVTAAAEMLKPIAKTHQFMTFTTPPNLQWGTATGLRLGDRYDSSSGSRYAAQARPPGPRLARSASRSCLRRARIS